MFRNIHIGTDTTPQYATWGLTYAGPSITLSPDSLTAYCNITWNVVLATVPFSDHQYYEFNSADAIVYPGIATAGANLTQACGYDTLGYAYPDFVGLVFNNNGYTNIGAPTWAPGDWIGVAYTTGQIQLYKNGVAAGTPIALAGGPWYPSCTPHGPGGILANFGQSAWNYAPPVGFTGVI